MNPYHKITIINPCQLYSYGLHKTDKSDMLLHPIISWGSTVCLLTSLLIQSYSTLRHFYTHFQHSQAYIISVCTFLPKNTKSLDVQYLFILLIQGALSTSIWSVCVWCLSPPSKDISIPGYYGGAMSFSFPPILVSLYMEYFKSELLLSTPFVLQLSLGFLVL